VSVPSSGSLAKTVLWQLGQACPSKDQIHAWHAAEQGLVLLPTGARFNHLLQVAIGVVELFFEPPDVCPDASRPRWGGYLEAVWRGTVATRYVDKHFHERKTE
jgi:hypothetical protein